MLETDTQWEARVEKRPIDEPIKIVSQRHMERNPGFDGNFVHTKTSNNQVVSVRLSSGMITNFAPLRGYPKLQELICTEQEKKSPLKDIQPLQGLLLERLVLTECEVDDLTPLRGMPLIA